MRKPDRCWWFYRGRLGQYVAVDPDSRMPHPRIPAVFSYFMRFAYEQPNRDIYFAEMQWRASFLRQLEMVEEKDVPDVFWSVLTGLPAKERVK